MVKSDQIIQNTIKKIFSNSIQIKKQVNNDSQTLPNAPKIKKSNLITDCEFWTKKSLKSIYDFIRGMSPPGIKLSIIINQNHKTTEKNIIITRVNKYKKLKDSTSSEIYIKPVNKYEILLTNEIASFNIQKLKLENGKEISSEEFYNGFIKNTTTKKRISIKETKS